jgi:hypothetical protein
MVEDAGLGVEAVVRIPLDHPEKVYSPVAPLIVHTSCIPTSSSPERTRDAARRRLHRHGIGRC